MKSLAEKLNELNQDIRAEAVVGNLIIQGIFTDDIIIEYDSSHKRNWDKDILKSESRSGKVFLKLSRDGFVHSLPEYLFRKPVEGSKDEKEKIIEFNKKQEGNTRVLFNPLENELFRKMVDLELLENEVHASLNTSDNKALKEFWMMDEHLDKRDQVKLAKILPSLHSIVGNFSLTAKCLEYILDEKVSWKKEDRIIDITRQTDPDTEPGSGGMGTQSCGDNMIVSGPLYETIPTLIFEIGPVDFHAIPFYLDDGKRKAILKYFTNYFIPLQYEVDFNVSVSVEEEGFTFDNAYMGFNTTL
jgi:hypothetical protein